MPSTAAALSDGRFVYQDKQGHLHIEDSCGGRFTLLFGGNSISFAIEEEKGWVALLLRSDADVVLRVYTLRGDELGEQLEQSGGLRVHPKACEVAWVGGGSFLLVSDVQSGTMVYAWSGESLRKCNSEPLRVMEQQGALPFAALQYVGVLERAAQVVHFYDTLAGEVVESYTLPNRQGRAQQPRVLTSTSADKNFVFLCNDDGTFHSVYVTKGSIRKLTPLHGDFNPRIHKRNANHGTSPPGGSVEDSEIGSPGTDGSPLCSPSPSPLPPSDAKEPVVQIVSCAVSSGQVLVGMDRSALLRKREMERIARGGGEAKPLTPLLVLRYKYLKKQVTMSVVASATPTVPPGTTLLAVSADGRCLVQSEDRVWAVTLEFESKGREESEGNDATRPSGTAASSSSGKEKKTEGSSRGSRGGRTKGAVAVTRSSSRTPEVSLPLPPPRSASDVVDGFLVGLAVGLVSGVALTSFFFGRRGKR